MHKSSIIGPIEVGTTIKFRKVYDEKRGKFRADDCRTAAQVVEQAKDGGAEERGGENLIGGGRRI